MTALLLNQFFEHISINELSQLVATKYFTEVKEIRQWRIQEFGL